MKTKTNAIYLAVFGIALLTILGAVSLVSANALFGKNRAPAHFPLMPSAFNKTFNDQLQLAVTNNDFTAWKSLMDSQLTQENFDRLVAISKNVSMHGNETEARDALPMNFTRGGNHAGRHFMMGNSTFPQGEPMRGQPREFNP